MSKAKSYSSILNYLENEDPDIAGVFKDCCVEYIISTRNKSGVTFLRPVDQKFRDMLIDKSLGEPNDKMEAIKLIAALVIPMNLKSAEDFNLNKLIIQNGNRQTIDISSVRAGVVTFGNGSTATKDAKFKDASQGNNISIYDLKGSGLPIDAPEAKRLERAVKRNPRGSTKGGYEIEQERANKDLRFQISTQAENIYARDKLAGKRTNAFLEYAYSLIYFILTRGGDDAKNDIFLSRMLPYVSYQEIDFYFFVEPHATHSEDEYLVPTSIIAEWWREYVDNGGVNGFNMRNIRGAIDNILKGQKSDSAALYAGEKMRKRLLDEIQNMRNDVIEEGARYSVNSVLKQYRAFAESNTIGGIKNVMPSWLAHRYHANPARKLLEDELRYVTYKIFRRYDTGDFVRDNYAEVLGMIGNYMHTKPTEEKLKLLNPRKIEFSVDANLNIAETCSFVQSTNYMFISLTGAEANYVNDKLYGQTERPGRESENIWNTTLDLHERMGTLVESRPSRTQDAPNPASNDEKVKGMLKQIYKTDKANLDPKMRGILDEMFRE